MVPRAPGRRPVPAAATALVAALLALVPLPERAGARWDGDVGGPCAIAPEPRGWVGEGPYTGRHLRPLGEQTATVLMVDFPDLPARSRAAERAAHFTDYAAEHLRRSSHGRYRPRFEPSDGWLRMPRPWPDYGIERGIPTATLQRYVEDAIGAATDRGVEFAETDLLIVVADDNVPASPMTSQAQTFTALRAGGSSVTAAAVVFGREGDSPDWQRGNFVHETLHLFGLPDLYDTTRGASTEFVGAWDPMSVAARSDLLGWHKWKFGWLADEDVACLPEGGTGLLRPVAAPGGGSLAVVPTGRATAFVAEARTRTGLDEGICTEGVLLYTVDSGVRTGHGPVRVLDSTPGSGGGERCGAREQGALAELGDAPVRPGGGLRAGAAGVTVEVIERTDEGYRVRITR
ncbi:M6 family metalloprotease domain-containing protein [Streptomyces chumphonensis]|uniref:Peptidase M6 n=1 Tax=Streptomyces chumphonensis TaxID=1214925 RepID=A0A927EV49_9ACTN|nr:peptidase M6 [Streptomyces chumphonensis]MBD3930220.1 peptidase M6 [Streptomyces chumphonensis]